MLLYFRPSWVATLLPCMVFGQYFPPTPEGNTVVNSRFGENITISYKEVLQSSLTQTETFLCETTPGVRSFSGYVHLPPDPTMSREYPINTFFWFFESRVDPSNAPLAIWLNGGPGASSVAEALGENGPCIVGEDSNSTTPNPWSWNNKANMLYVDQPVQVGFSYDTLVNGTFNALATNLLPIVADFSEGVPEQNDTFFVGTFPSLNSKNTANSTGNAAPAVWTFLQAWLRDFPMYQSPNNELSIWAESYGGHWGPGLASFIEKQNDKIAAGALERAKVINLDTVGIINGGIDFKVTAVSYPDMAHNNTYSFQAITDAEYESAMKNLTTCTGLIDKCQGLGAIYDPDNYGNDVAVNTACSAAYGYCALDVEYVLLNSGHGAFDIGHTTPDPTPSKYEIGFLNRHWVQSALGVPLNFTYQNQVVYNSVMAEGDITRGGFLDMLGNLLDRGIQVALMYGDRDYIGNWIAGERGSLAITSEISKGFTAAGYANISTNATYEGGVVRQHGNLSFSRVFDAAHGVPYYQPETAYRIFDRAMSHVDIATGQRSITADYSTSGPSSSFQYKNQMPEDPKKVCYTLMALTTCTTADFQRLAAGTAIVRDFVLVGYVEGNATIWY
ncbi:Carboxypeptidase S1-like protein A [Lachnellula willkommii]|uniref:Carboxypeptidase n=1 Tax=Lachnellula willkommii TaxID=215461 RepID=A0A559MNB6_9HELO|nr:Carboxypeptidase S1-like protein A [Lachnellula willkommii]